MNVGDVEACRAFYEEVIGLVVTEADDDAVYLFMAWRPEAQEKTAS
jgi:catechol-2,3-dioxygenase